MTEYSCRSSGKVPDLESIMKNLAGVVTLFTVTLVSLGIYVARPVFGDEIGAESSEEILALRASFYESIKNHDAASIAAYLDSEYQIATSSGEHYRETPEEDVAVWTEIFRDNEDIVYVRTPDVVEVSSYYDSAAETGTWAGQADCRLLRPAASSGWKASGSSPPGDKLLAGCS